MKRLLKKSLAAQDLKKLFQAGQLTRNTIHGSLDQQVIQEHFSITDVQLGDNAVLDIPGVTFVFDLEGSSASIRDQGEHDFIDTYAEMFRGLSEIIYLNNGIIEKFPGDGISAHFLKYDDPNLDLSRRRAATAANAIQAYMRRKNFNGYRISMWSGPTTVATTIGNADHHELISIGHGVNMAHKLEKVIKENGFTVGMDYEISRHYSEIANRPVNLRTLPPSLTSDRARIWYGA
ncbi:MAG: hypothetical protein K0Q73_5204 [Paenibacillus sp.]|jgi:class 3 adenylate cyclase|nr:hypothetical protein [Paenibacillus sp.]